MSMHEPNSERPLDEDTIAMVETLFQSLVHFYFQKHGLETITDAPVDLNTVRRFLDSQRALMQGLVDAMRELTPPKIASLIGEHRPDGVVPAIIGIIGDAQEKPDEQYTQHFDVQKACADAVQCGAGNTETTLGYIFSDEWRRHATLIAASEGLSAADLAEAITAFEDICIEHTLGPRRIELHTLNHSNLGRIFQAMDGHRSKQIFSAAVRALLSKQQ